MQEQILKQSAAYNEFVRDAFSKIEFSPLRNSPHWLWMKRGAISLREAIKNLLSMKSLTKKEKLFLEKMQKIITSGINGPIVKMDKKEANGVLSLSMEAMIERDDLVKKDLLEKENFTEFREALFLLEANSRLLKLVKNKLDTLSAEKQDFLNVQGISKSLFKTYLFLLGEIEENFLKESMLDIKAIWRDYNPLSKLMVV
ncbi:hypothetical protein CMI37_19370 [Candidatus Pacearchaeota archaeon]|nr:hypothetical protein [Candidatus Pacearchaeota archaeon]|tara:strand:+ start:1635 stop:2234 length:600 start_codon:yes stop_codon:yes gene_type:complete